MEQKITKDNFVRTQFTFYRSYWECLDIITNPKERCQAYDILMEYAFYNKMPDLNRLTPLQKLFFTSVKPSLDTARANAWGGMQGKGRSRKKEESMTVF